MKPRYIVALTGLILLIGLLLGATVEQFYGQKKVRSYTAGTGSGTITAADGRSWTWTTNRMHVIVQLAGTATGNLYCRVNETTANASGSEWDFYLEAGQSWNGYGHVQMEIESIACFADASPGTEGTDYIVKGVD